MNVVPLTLIGGICVYMVTHSLLLQQKKTARIRARLMVLTIWTLAIVLWPAIWAAILGAQSQKIAAFPSLIWPILIVSIDIMTMRQNTYESHIQSKRSILTIDANAICSLTFAMSGIIGAHKHKCCNRIFLYAVLGCIAFVMPAPHSHLNAIETITIEAVQKAILAYATGLLLAGVMLVTSDNEINTSTE